MRYALIGNPSVGKSLIFNQLTGLGVEVSNYPGTTVELHQGNVCFKRDLIEVVDLPGIYSLEGDSEEERLVRRFLEEHGADAIIAVVDATRLERNLYLLLQVAEYGLPMIVVVNMIDEAEAEGLKIDVAHLKEVLGVEALPTAAAMGKNIDQIIPLADAASTREPVEIPYDQHIEAAIRSLSKMFGVGRRVSLNALVGIGSDPDLIESAKTIAEEIEDRHRMSINQIIAANRHNFARQLSNATLHEREMPHRIDPDNLLTRTFPGIPILVAILTGMLLVVFTAGAFLEEMIVGMIQVYALEPFLSLGLPLFPEVIGKAVIIALQAGLGIAFPYIFIFYILLSILEDTGYLTRAAFLADNAMHRIGMHGGGIIPLILAFGCNVPAIMGTRLLSSRRERIIAAFLVTMIPCSARTVIISGIVAKFVGIPAAFSIYIIVFILIILTGLLLSRITPGERYGMIMEMAPLRRPKPRLILTKSWLKLREFLFIAMPLLLAGSVILGILEFAGVTAAFQEIITPASQAILGIPGYAATALLFGILRKEMAFETLAILSGSADLASVMTPHQLYIFALVTVLFVPCLSTIAVLAREHSYRLAFLVSGYTVSLGIAIGSIINYVLK